MEILAHFSDKDGNLEEGPATAAMIHLLTDELGVNRSGVTGAARCHWRFDNERKRSECFQ